MTTLDWTQVRRRYAKPTAVAPLAGSSRLTAVLDGDGIRVSQRLWSATVTRADLQTALHLLRSAPPLTALALAEQLRTHQAHATECSRIPTLSTALLIDLGYLPGRTTATDRKLRDDERGGHG